MKDIFSLSIIVILLLSSVSVIADYSTNPEEIEKIITFSQIKTLSQEDELSIVLDGANQVSFDSGHVLPAYTEKYTFPIGTKIKDISINPKHTQQITLTKELAIAPTPVIDGIAAKNSKSPNSLSSSEPFEMNWFDYDLGIGLKGDERCLFLTIELFPIQYNSKASQVTWAETFDITVEYDEPEIVSSSAEDYDLVILTPADFQQELQSLVTHKNNRNVSTKLVTLDEIYSGAYFTVDGRDEPEKIKYFIKNAIESWGIDNLLLVGGSDQFPTRETHVYVDYGSGDAEVFVTDLYYADIYDENMNFSDWDSNQNDIFGEYNWNEETDDVDLYPDVHFGRLACVDVEEVETVVNKIITYETNEVWTSDWFTNLIVIGGDTHPGDEDGVSEGELVNQKIMDIMNGFIPIKCWASEGNLARRTDINNAFSQGAGFVDFSGHGNPSLWGTHPFEKPDVWIPIGNFKNTNAESLNNGDQLPIVVTGACSVGKFNELSDCFTWSFVSNDDGGGIGAFGTTALSWGYTGKYTADGLGGKMQLELFKAYRDHGAITFGEMWSRAISNYISPGMDGGDYKTIEEWQSFGDPTLSIADESMPPEKPAVPIGNSTGKPNEEYTFSSSTTDPDGDSLYYLFDWGDETFSEWLGPFESGELVEATHSWDEEGEYQIRVMAKDDHGVQGEWSDSLPVSMPKTKFSFSFFEQFLARLGFFDFGIF